ncbi:MAG: hypothetical protein NTW87_25575 [Planctomycetota bacterium]|nr:hypothetical protein [Planctomycetota bacterium]
MGGRLRAIVCGLGVVLLAGCERAVPRTDYLPLRDANRWEYRLLDMPLLQRLAEGQAIVTAPLDSSGGAREAGADSDLAPKAEVLGVDAPGSGGKPGTDAAAAPSTVSPTARRVVLELREAVDDLTYRAVYDTAEQVWSKRNGYIGFQSARGRSYLLILPPHTGYRWIVTGPGGQDLFYEVESAAATVTTPAGTFKDCALARQETRERRETFRYWFAPNVGLVRRSKYFLNEEVFRQELVEYSVKPATPGARMAEEREVKKAVMGQRRGSEFREGGGEKKGPLERIEPPDFDRVDDRVRKYGDPR